MDILGSIGQLYTFILLVLLFLGSGLAVWAVINSVVNNKGKIKENLKKNYDKLKNNKIIGGFRMKSNGFVKLAVFAFIGIIISAAILMALPNPNANAMGNMNIQGYTNGMNVQTGMNGQNGMANSAMQGSMYGNASADSIQQQLYYMQQQINQMQSQINNNQMGGMQSQGMSGSNMNNNMNSMNNNSMNNNSMNNNSMNNGSMNNSNMNSNNMNNSNMNSNSGSSMSMM